MERGQVVLWATRPRRTGGGEGADFLEREGVVGSLGWALTQVEKGARLRKREKKKMDLSQKKEDGWWRVLGFLAQPNFRNSQHFSN